MSSTLALPAAVEFATRLVQAMGAPDAVARVALWRAHLGEAVARGDLAPFRALAAGGVR